MRRTILFASVAIALALLGAGFASAARADIVGPITFEPSQGYVPGDINGQMGWQKLNPLYDVKVATVSSYPAAANYGFGTQALRLSDFFTSGSFGDQAFSPGLTQPAGEAPGLKHEFFAAFAIGTALSTQQSGLHTTVSPDDGNGGRMSYLRFEDQANGVHVFFDDAKNPGPFGATTTFNEKDIATLSRTRSHSAAFLIQFKPGPHNDKVDIYIDGKKRASGTTWEDYYRYDVEQAGNGNQVPPVRKLLFRESGTPNPLNLNNGFLLDYVTLASGDIGDH